ncbi:arginase [Kaustia mangrovi]|uniref:Arginase n=1 Tax=Kaustia mangrovi TaxID=2593653 RepID=A0A7S8C3W4_9HYPH|nr:arginase [Kaustia mangrovi]QPC42887.1 arginase [Kaustia mangrovi]
MHCTIIDAPVRDGAGRAGCDMGPGALRAAGLIDAISGLGHRVADAGRIERRPLRAISHGNTALKALPEIAAWTEALSEAAYAASDGAMPIFLGGDHSISAGTLAGLARRAQTAGRPLFVLWLDAHPDFHTLETTTSGNLHGIPLAYAAGRPGFAGYLPDLPATVDPERICLFGIRSVDPAERDALNAARVTVHDMRAIRRHGAATPIGDFLARIAREDGLLHVSLDVDFLDPGIAPAVGTAVPGGATLDEARLVMALLSQAGLVTSLDLVELNPVLDGDGRTARLIVDLVADLMGRRIERRPATARPTRSF